MGGKHGPPEVRFWSHVDKSGDCWEWMRATTRHGYGVFGVSPTDGRFAHRYAWELQNGPIPSGLVIMHRCDNPPCVRIDHLQMGTQADNLADMRAKGRNVIAAGLAGETNPAARLTEEQVRRIRSDPRPSRAVAKEYAVGKSTVLRILRRDNWKEVSDVA